MTKRPLYIDLDNTAWNFTEAFCEGANLIYEKELDSPVDWKDVRKYDFSDQYPFMDKDKKRNMLDSYLVFNSIRYYDDMVEVINEISKQTKVYFVSVCGIDTIARKYKKVRDDFPLATFIPILIHKGQGKPTKSIVNMGTGVLLDDQDNNLFECNAPIKICMNYLGNDVEWNREWRSYGGMTFTRFRKGVEGKQLKELLGVE